MSDDEKLSPVAMHALVVSCMASNVPVPLSDDATVERVAGLLRARPEYDDEAER